MLAKLQAALPPALRKNSAPQEPVELVSHIGANSPPADQPRIRALETLWGAGRFGPGCGELDDTILDALGFTPDTSSPVGLLGTDPVLALAARNRFGTQVQTAEWRQACAQRGAELVPDLPITVCDLNRPRGFELDSLTGLISQDAMAFADHKSGLATQIFRLLKSGGSWIMFDILRDTDHVPETAFGSSWAEPQLPTPDTLEAVLMGCGFEIVERLDAKPLIAQAVNNGFKRLGQITQDMQTPKNPLKLSLMLQELAWEAASWKARLAAIRDQNLMAVIWTIRKPLSDETPASAPTEAPAEASPPQDADAPAETETA